MSDSTTQQDGKAMPPASAGSYPVLWTLEWKEDAGCIDPEWVYATREEAAEVNENGCYGRATVVPLYREPALTDEEREAIIHGQAALDQVGTEWTLKCAATLRGLLERLK